MLKRNNFIKTILFREYIKNKTVHLAFYIIILYTTNSNTNNII